MAQSPAAPEDDAAHLLVIDDDERIRSLVARFLSGAGYRVTVAEDAADARRKLDSILFDLIIADVMMPGESGFDLLAAIRDHSAVPVIMLTALNEAGDRVRGLELGADDYVVKPFEPRELALRIANILKRGGPRATEKPEAIRFGPFVFHLERQELRRDDEIVRLTDRERQLLATFAEKPGLTVPRHLLAGGDGVLGERTVDVQINRLRRKIEVDPANPVWLQTVRGVGYRLMTD